LAAEAKQCVSMPQETAARLDFDPAYDRYGSRSEELYLSISGPLLPLKAPSALCDRASILQGVIGRQAVAAVPIAQIFPLSLSGPQRCCNFTLPKFHVRAKMRT